MTVRVRLHDKRYTDGGLLSIAVEDGVKLPRVAYILLWFPKPSETFIFREVSNLWNMGVPIKVFSLYGELTRSLSPEMVSVSNRVERLGIPYAATAPTALLAWWRKDRALTREVLRTLSLKRWSGLEKTLENLWAFCCGFHLARRFQEERIQHIHAPWASGPATAAWTASRLTGIPFSFTARAWDIFPPDKGLKDKIRDAAFVRCETGYNVHYLGGLMGGDTSKLHLTYNGVPLQAKADAPVFMKPPYRLLALGRFVGKKGYDYLLKGCRLIRDRDVEFRLTLAGDGPKMRMLKRLAKRLGLEDWVEFPGFVPYDRVSELFDATDVFLMPSVVDRSGDRDGIPTVIMEALMHRIPVIATDVSGISEVIHHRVTGLLIREKDPNAIADAVLEMVSDRDRALDLARAGRSKVKTQFDPVTCHQKALTLFQEHS